MPFTPAHSAIVLPLIKSKRFSATGLIIGSMVPDFEYFFKMSVNSRFSHTLGGLFYFGIPVTIFLALLFHEVVKKNLIDNLPAIVQQRLQPLRQFQFIPYFRTHYLVFMISALVGAGSHIGWDAFTHADGYFVAELPFVYKGAVVPLDGARYPLWYALQHISTWVGLAVLVVYLAVQPATRQSIAKPSIWYWLCVIGIGLLVVMLRFQFNFDKAFLGDLVVSSISATTLAMIVLGLTWKAKPFYITHG